MVFSGPAVDVLPFFKSYGMECETFNNPADFTLDMLINEEMAHPGEPIPMVLKYQPMAADNDTGHGDAEDCDSPPTQLTRGLPQLATGEHSIGWCTQFSVLANRQTKQIYRNPQTVFLPIFANIFMAIVWGTIFYDVPDTGTAGVQNRIGGFFFIIMNLVFGNLAMVPVFVEDRRQFVQERSLGYYRSSSYFVSKVLTDIVPNRIFPVLVFGVIVYWMMGFQADLCKFLIFLACLVQVAVSAGSCAYFCACVTSIFVVANQLLGLIYVFGMLFSGLLIRTDSLPIFLQWAQWLSFYRYAQAILARNEFEGQTFTCTDAEILKGCFQYGDDVLNTFDWDLSLGWSMLGLNGLSVLFLGAGLYSLQVATRRK